MNTRVSGTIIAALVLMAFAATSNASSLIGTSVTGSLTFPGDPSNYFNPGYGFVPSSDLNAIGITVTISAAAVEFGYDDGVANAISADFTANQLIVTDVVEGTGTNTGFQMMFTDTEFANQYFVPASTLTLIDSYSSSGDIITLNSGGGSVTAGETFTDTFTFTPVPEPAALGCVFAALLPILGAFAGSRRRRSGISEP